MAPGLQCSNPVTAYSPGGNSWSNAGVTNDQLPTWSGGRFCCFVISNFKTNSSPFGIGWTSSATHTRAATDSSLLFCRALTATGSLIHSLSGRWAHVARLGSGGASKGLLVGRMADGATRRRLGASILAKTMLLLAA